MLLDELRPGSADLRAAITRLRLAPSRRVMSSRNSRSALATWPFSSDARDFEEEENDPAALYGITAATSNAEIRAIAAQRRYDYCHWNVAPVTVLLGLEEFLTELRTCLQAGAPSAAALTEADLKTWRQQNPADLLTLARNAAAAALSRLAGDIAAPPLPSDSRGLYESLSYVLQQMSAREISWADGYSGTPEWRRAHAVAHHAWTLVVNGQTALATGNAGWVRPVTSWLYLRDAQQGKGPLGGAFPSGPAPAAGHAKKAARPRGFQPGTQAVSGRHR